jgi:hypothetical protein
VVLYVCETCSLTLEEHRLRVSENRRLRIFGPKRDEMRWGWKNLCIKELHKLYSLPSIFCVYENENIWSKWSRRWEVTYDAAGFSSENSWRYTFMKMHGLCMCTWSRTAQKMSSTKPKFSTFRWTELWTPKVLNWSQLKLLAIRKHTKPNSVAFSPQANYTDRATAACRRS